MDNRTLPAWLLADAHDQLSEAAACLACGVVAADPVGTDIANDMRLLALAVERELLAVEAILVRLLARE